MVDKELIRKAIRKFIDNDKEGLLKANIHESAISHTIGVYLGEEFKNYNVDCEYNRDRLGQKNNSTGKKIRPDIIIHMRNSDINLVIFDIKKSGKDSKKEKSDIDKLKDVLSSKLSYELGVYVGVLKRKIDICWVEKICDKIGVSCEILKEDSYGRRSNKTGI